MLLLVLGISNSALMAQGKEKPKPASPGSVIPPMSGEIKSLFIPNSKSQSGQDVVDLINEAVKKGGRAYLRTDKFNGIENPGTSCASSFSYGKVGLIMPDSNVTVTIWGKNVPELTPLRQKSTMLFHGRNTDVFWPRLPDFPDKDGKKGKKGKGRSNSHWPFNIFASYEVQADFGPGKSPFNRAFWQKYSLGIMTEPWGRRFGASFSVGYYPQSDFSWLLEFYGDRPCPCNAKNRKGMLAIQGEFNGRIPLGVVGKNRAEYGIALYAGVNIAITNPPDLTQSVLDEAGLSYKIMDFWRWGVNGYVMSRVSAYRNGKPVPTGTTVKFFAGPRINVEGVGGQAGALIAIGGGSSSAKKKAR